MTAPKPAVQIRPDQAEALGGCAPCQFQAVAANPSDPSKPKGPPPKSVVVVDPTKEHWIGIELVDSRKKPVGNVEFVLTVPGGQRVPGTLDAYGKSRIEGIDPGTCTVQFPTLDRRDFI